MKTMTLNALREQVERKKAAIGWVDDEANTTVLRNTGMARTPEKYELLSRIGARVKVCGHKALRSSD